MAKTTEQQDLVNRFKELWINELMPTFKKDLLSELKTEIGKQLKLVTERFESKIRDCSALRTKLLAEIHNKKQSSVPLCFPAHIKES